MSRRNGDGASLSFDDFYELYPRRVGRDDAERAWGQLTKKTAPKAIVDGLIRQRPSLLAREKKFIPHPATWLRQGRWKDEDVDGGSSSGSARVDEIRASNEEAKAMFERMTSTKGDADATG